MRSFSVTYETFTEESVEHGDAAERGYLASGLPFREALELFNRERTWSIVESDSYPISDQFPPRWITDYGDPEWASGVTRTVSLHIPKGVTGSSAMRIARLVNCYGSSRRH